MQLGTVIGHATSTIKHPSFHGWRLVIAQPLGIGGRPEAEPVVAVDRFGAGVGQRVMLDADRHGAREYVGDERSPVRWFVAGIVDD